MCLQLHLQEDAHAATATETLFAGCPGTVTALPAAGSCRCYSIQLAEWAQMPEALAWFSSSILQQQQPGSSSTHARLAFPPCLPKEQRANVHTCVSKKHASWAASTSEGLGEQRHVAVVPKAAIKPHARRMNVEQADHALALWLLWKEARKQQQVQQQQQQVVPADVDAVAAQLAAEWLDGASSSGASEADTASPREPLPAAAAAGWEYSRDEVAQMLASEQLTDELSRLWRGPLGAAQRSARLLCLAAAAGDMEELQALLANEAHAAVLRDAVRDLSAGGALPLHLAASGGQAEALRVLLAAGAPLEATDGRDQTALQVAQRSEQCDCEAVLLQAGAHNTQQDSWQGLGQELQGSLL